MFKVDFAVRHTSVERQPIMGRSGFVAKDATAGSAPVGDFQRLHYLPTSNLHFSLLLHVDTRFLRW